MNSVTLINATSVEDIDFCLNRGDDINKSFKIIDEMFDTIYAVRTPFEYHCHEGHTELVKHLINKGCKFTIDAFNNACWGGYMDIFNFLVSSFPIDFNECDKSGQTPLMCACTEIWNYTPLMNTYIANKKEIVIALLKNGVDVNKRDREGETAAHYAARWKSPDIFNLLLENGADLTIKNNKNETPIFLAMWLRRHDTVKKILESNINVNVSDVDKCNMCITDIAKHNDDHQMINLIRDFQHQSLEISN